MNLFAMTEEIEVNKMQNSLKPVNIDESTHRVAEEKSSALVDFIAF